MCASLRVHGASFGIRGKQQRHNDTEVEKNHNTWNELLVVLALLGYSPPIQRAYTIGSGTVVPPCAGQY